MTKPGSFNHQAELRAFLQMIAGKDVEVVEAQDNRVPQPIGKTYIVLQPLFHNILGTNIIVYSDNIFVGDIVGTTLTVSEVRYGTLHLGVQLFSLGVVPGTTIDAQLSGEPGGAGTYLVSPAQDLGSRQMSGGKVSFTVPIEAKFQVSVFSDNPVVATDLMDKISAMFVTENAQDVMPNAVPLYMTNPKQIPFINAANQAEWRWISELSVQANQTVDWSQQFMNEVVITFMPIYQETT